MLGNTFIPLIKIFKGTTTNGSTTITEWYDSAGVLREKVDTAGFKQIRYRDEYVAGEWCDASGAASPDLTSYTIGGVGVRLYAFDGGTTEEKKSNHFEIAHDLAFTELNAETEFIEAHIHWMPSTNNTGNVEWFFDYYYHPLNAAPISQTSLSVVSTVSANQQYFHKIDAFLSSAIVKVPKPSSGFSLGDIISFTLRRTPAGTNDTYGDDAILYKVALHVPTNDFGSRQRYIK
jgi:hypothetical protein